MREFQHNIGDRSALLSTTELDADKCSDTCISSSLRKIEFGEEDSDIHIQKIITLNVKKKQMGDADKLSMCLISHLV